MCAWSATLASLENKKECPICAQLTNSEPHSNEVRRGGLLWLANPHEYGLGERLEYGELTNDIIAVGVFSSRRNSTVDSVGTHEGRCVTYTFV